MSHLSQWKYLSRPPTYIIYHNIRRSNGEGEGEGSQLVIIAPDIQDFLPVRDLERPQYLPSTTYDLKNSR